MRDDCGTSGVEIATFDGLDDDEVLGRVRFQSSFSLSISKRRLVARSSRSTSVGPFAEIRLQGCSTRHRELRRLEDALPSCDNIKS